MGFLFVTGMMVSDLQLSFSNGELFVAFMRPSGFADDQTEFTIKYTSVACCFTFILVGFGKVFNTKSLCTDQVESVKKMKTLPAKKKRQSIQVINSSCFLLMFHTQGNNSRKLLDHHN